MITPEQLAANPSEHSQQAALFCWAAQHVGSIPELALLFAIPNGGKRDKITGARMRAEGVKPGVPDIFWALPRSRPNPYGGTLTGKFYHGLFLEMKVGSGGLSSDQEEWRDRLKNQGYAYAVCYGYMSARAVLADYHSGRPMQEVYR